MNWEATGSIEEIIGAVISLEAWQAHEALLRVPGQCQPVQEWWDVDRDAFSPGFRAQAEILLAEEPVR